MPKLNYKVKVIAGDFYYEKMPQQETMRKAFVYPESPEKELKN